MKKILLLLLFPSVLFAQEFSDTDINNLQRLTKSYIGPGAKTVMYTLSNGWFHTAKVNEKWSVNVELIGEASLVNDKDKSFYLNSAAYDGVVFKDGSTAKNVATILGENNEDVIVEYTYTNPFTGEQQTTDISLPNGVNGGEVNIVPSSYLQLGVVVAKATEVKLRYFPKNSLIDNIDAGIYGIGVQHELSSWFTNSFQRFNVSLFAGYTNIDGRYLVKSNSQLINGGFVENESQVFTYQILTSYPMNKFTLLAGLGYVNTISNSSFSGKFVVDDLPVIGQA